MKIKDPEDQRSIWDLYSKRAWLMDFEKEFIELLNFVETRENKSLLFGLLERFTCLDENQFTYYLDQIAKHIINDSGFKPEETVICALSAGNEADSGQAIVQSLKVCLAKNGWANFATCNRINGLNKRCTEGRRSIVLVDEFLGTGTTLHKRINEVKGMCKDYSPQLYVCIVVGMEFGIAKITEEGGQIFCPLMLKKGITDHYGPGEIEHALEQMRDIESRLAPVANGRSLGDFSFGYGQSESLFARACKHANIPNNTFPIFWWPQDRNLAPRNPLFVRYDYE